MNVTCGDQAFPSHSLSEAALAMSGAPIFLLDSYSEVMVYYTAEATSEQALPFPPPQVCHHLLYAAAPPSEQGPPVLAPPTARRSCSHLRLD